jgi:hypothetical protein
VPDTRDLCTVAQVKSAMEPALTTSARDARIQDLITAASVRIMRRLERELTPKANAIRRFPISLSEVDAEGCHVVDLAPFDLRSAATVTLHPEDASPDVLTASEYALEPVGAPQGSYLRIRLANTISLASEFATRFGYAQLEINGAWGIWDTADVAPEVREACILTVRSWLRQNPAAYAFRDNEEPTTLQPVLPVTWEIPFAAMQNLLPWSRYGL